MNGYLLVYLLHRENDPPYIAYASTIIALNEEELPGASNTLPTATKEALKSKPSLE